jgi:pimeloyl-ACP methyl ester carboxylesterase
VKNALLVHGLGRTPVSMIPLANRLQGRQFRTRFFAYSATFESMPRIVSRLVRTIESAKPDVIICHSLGGVLTRMAIAEQPPRSLRHLVMLGTPNRSPKIARFCWNWFPFRAFSRSCGEFLSSPAAYEGLPVPEIPITVIAGTSGPEFVFGEPNDGIVTVSETQVHPDFPSIALPGLHSLMMNSKTVQDTIVERIRKS